MNSGHVCGRGGRAYAQADLEACRPKDRSPPAGSRSCERLSVGQPEFPAFEAQLQVYDGAVHHLVLFRTKTCPESNGCSPLPSPLGIARTSRAGTINQRLAAVRRLAYEAADSGLLSPELAAGIRRVKGVKQLGCRAGNWLNREQAGLLLEKSNGERLRNVRDVAMIAILLGCGLRRAELSSLRKEDIQIRQGHWAIVDLVGKGNHVRTVPMPGWVKGAVDRWLTAASVTTGRVSRAVSRHGTPWGAGISENVICKSSELCSASRTRPPRPS
jgi:hypothetical protein